MVSAEVAGTILCLHLARTSKLTCCLESRPERGGFVPAFPHFIASKCVNIPIFPLGTRRSLFHTGNNYSRTLVNRTAQMLTTHASQFLRHS
jgi:hypothetical protein